MPATLLAVSLCVAATPSYALFGLDLFGKKEAKNIQNVPDPLAYTPELSVIGDADLKPFLEENSILIQKADEVVSGYDGLIARASSDRAALVAALYEKARFGGTVDITIDGQPLDAIVTNLQSSDGRKPSVKIVVTPGPEFRIGTIRVDSDVDVDPSDYGLVPGGNAGSSAVLAAETRIRRDWRAKGHPLAKVTNRDIVADHDNNHLDIVLSFNAGPMARFGRVRVTGRESMREEVVLAQAAVPEGAAYDPAVLDEVRERLAKLEVFSSINVDVAETLNPDGTVDVIIQLEERKLRVIGGGVSWSNEEAFGIEAYWAHRNLFGGGEKFRVEANVGRLGSTTDIDEVDYSLSFFFAKPGAFGPTTRFDSSIKVGHERPDAFDRFWFTTEVGVSKEFSKTTSGSVGAIVDLSEQTDVFGREQHLLLAAPVRLAYDTRDNKLDPKRGFHLTAFGEPAYDAFTGVAFGTVRGSAATYKALGKSERFVLAARLSGGSIFAPRLSDVPADRRFYGGGGGSVRGFDFQAVGPQTAAGRPTGGLSFAEASLEARIGVTESLSFVPFFDAGTVSNDILPGTGTWRFGAGLGLRYATPVGPLRLDVGVPLNRRPNDSRFGIYAGIGQSF